MISLTRFSAVTISSTVRRDIVDELGARVNLPTESSISALTAPAALAALCARLRTSDATTAKPLPCSPARAVSMAALTASRFVLDAMVWTYLTGLWEFPGGKVEAAGRWRRLFAASRRRSFRPGLPAGESVDTIRRQYPGKALVLHFYRCRLERGTIEPRESQAMAWANPAELSAYDLPPADRAIVSRSAAERG
jgi:8-oxo-dGTP diphosphatase